MRVAILVVLCLFVLFVGAVGADGFLSVWGDSGASLQAHPSWYGSSGMVVTPTAAVLAPTKAAVLAAQYSAMNQ